MQHIFIRFPVYQVLGESEFKVEIHEKKFAAYSGEKDVKAVAEWLDENTEPLIVNVVETNPAKKLTKALEDQTPLLIIVNRDNSEAFTTNLTAHLLQILFVVLQTKMMRSMIALIIGSMLAMRNLLLFS